MKVQINYKGIDLLISGYYTEKEQEIMYDSNFEGYPGCSAEFEIQTIKLLDSDVDIFNFLEDDLDDIVELCIEAIEA